MKREVSAAGRITLVVGANGGTGRRLVKHLLDRDQRVRVVVRSAESLSEDVRKNPLLEVNEASVPDLDEGEWVRLVGGCGAVASCLGHNLTFKGIYGRPRKLVTDAVRSLCRAVAANDSDSNRPVKVLLLNTAGYVNRDSGECVSLAQRAVLGLIRALLPPHPDNEKAAEHLCREIGSDDRNIEWVVVRPDTLIEEETVTSHEVLPSPTRSAIFDPGKTSRINVGRFMADLITDDGLWDRWKGRMPVIYNTAGKAEAPEARDLLTSPRRP